MITGSVLLIINIPRDSWRVSGFFCLKKFFFSKVLVVQKIVVPLIIMEIRKWDVKNSSANEY